MSIVDRVPTRAVRWISKQQFRPVVGPVVQAGASRLRRKPRVVSRGQAKGLRIDPSGTAAGYALGTSEPLTQAVFAEQIRSGGVMWDVGANIGFYSLIASRLVGDGKVIAFEPLPANQAAIRRNLALNEITNVELIGLALGDHEGTADLQLHGGNSWAKLDTSADTSFRTRRGVADTIQVQISTLDAQLGNVPPPSFVKIDIEGAEVAALRGATNLLTEHRPVLIVEIHGTNEAVTDLLESRDYIVRTVEAPHISPRDAGWSVHVLATPRPATRPSKST
jgi:FkbM family methyltransferase